MTIFDLETDTDEGIEKVRKVHVIALYDDATGSYEVYDREAVRVGVEKLARADCLCGHNIIGYDLPVLSALYPDVPLPTKIIDTLVWGRLVYPDIKEVDLKLWKEGRMPGQFIGTHSLESYGYRLGILKGEFHKTADWSKWTPEMSDYCKQDVKVNVALVQKLKSKETTEEAFGLEHQVAKIIDRQVKHGFLFDQKKAEKLYAEVLIPKREEIRKKLQQIFGCWYVKDGKKDFVPKQNNKKMGYHAGCPVTKIKLVQFNPASRHHIAYQLQKRYGWKPAEWNDDGTPKLDEEVIKDLPYPEAQPLAEYLMLDKRCGQLAEGKQAWLKVVGPDGRIHGSVNSNGAVSGRMIHFKPNIAQVPKALPHVPYGYECRDLFHVRPGYKLVGADASGLELRCLSHFMARFDGGAYIKVLLEGDIHTVNQHAAGIPNRDKAKTFIYAFIYGAGDELLGELVGGGKKAGSKLRRQFLKKTPALKMLIDAVHKAAKEKGYLKGLDGRKLKVRSIHSSLNLLLQSAGALIMKKALTILDENLQARGLTNYSQDRLTYDYESSANVHDEFQIEVKEQYAEVVGQMAVQAIRDAGEYFKFRCPLDGEYKVGNSWAETH